MSPHKFCKHSSYVWLLAHASPQSTNFNIAFIVMQMDSQLICRYLVYIYLIPCRNFRDYVSSTCISSSWSKYSNVDSKSDHALCYRSTVNLLLFIYEENGRHMNIDVHTSESRTLQETTCWIHSWFGGWRMKHDGNESDTIQEICWF